MRVRFPLPAPDNSLLVQLVERRTVNPYVTGSSPVEGAKFISSLNRVKEYKRINVPT